MAITTSYGWIHGTDLQLNNIFTNGDQTMPAVASNAAGDRFFAAWSDPNNAWQAQGRIVAADMTPINDEFTVNYTENLGDWQYDINVAGLTNGDFVTTYTDLANDPGGDVRARIYTENGNARGIDFAINDNPAFDDTESSVAALSNGNFVVSFTRETGGANVGIRTQVFDSNGDPVTASLVVDAGTGQTDSAVAGLSGGGFVVAWEDTSSNEVYFRRYESDGSALDPDRVLIDTTGAINRDIHVAALSDGGFAVAYTDSGWNIDGTEITFRIFNADGTTRSEFIRANNADFGGIEAGSQFFPTITTMGDLIVVGWRDGDSNTAYSQVFDAQGNALGENTAFSSGTESHRSAGLANGHLATVWTSDVSEGVGLGDSMQGSVSQFMRTLTGDADDNLIVGTEDGLHERLSGGNGNDVLKGGGGSDELWGGLGFDTASYGDASSGVTANLSDSSGNTGDAAGDTYFLVENLAGSVFDDTLVGNSVANTLSGGDGNDMLVGGGGANTLEGGNGDDTAAFALNFNDYIVQDIGTKIIVTGPGGVNNELTSIEHLQFADTTITVANVANDGDALFDTLYYLSRNGDVFQAGANARDHYNAFGWHEGRDPNAFFDSADYLAVNKDVAAAGMNPLEHYRHHGWKEGRDPSADFDTTLYLINNPDVAAAGVNPLEHFLQTGMAEGRDAFPAIGGVANGFDAQFYLFHNPDVAAAGADALTHYNTYGWNEGRDPNAFFDSDGYLSTYGDVAAAGVNPLEHYMMFGWQEGRDASAAFDTAGYLAANADVAAAGVNPLQHYLQFGIYEGRMLGSDGMWG